MSGYTEVSEGPCKGTPIYEDLCKDPLVIGTLIRLANGGDGSTPTATLLVADGDVVRLVGADPDRRREAAFFVSKYLDSDRLMEIEHARLNELGTMLAKKVKVQEPIQIKGVNKLKIRELDASRVKEITRIYRKVFNSYPFPIDDPEYILKTMKGNVRYFGIEKKGNLIALASAEIDRAGSNAEMTDFATMPEYRGNSLATLLLAAMEKGMSKSGIKTLFTIARLNSLAMNKTFLKLQYIYSGTLVKNTNIAGKIESMNVYYKHL